MKKAYSKKEREVIRFYKILGITGLTFILIISAWLAIFNEPNNNTGNYTAEQLKHDHDYDGIPDH